MPERSSCGVRGAPGRSGRFRFGAVAQGVSFLLLPGCPQLLTDDFGLGSAGEVERVEVLWPSGRRSVVEKPKTDATLRIEEPRQ